AAPPGIAEIRKNDKRVIPNSVGMACSNRLIIYRVINTTRLPAHQIETRGCNAPCPRLSIDMAFFARSVDYWAIAQVSTFQNNWAGSGAKPLTFLFTAYSPLGANMNK